MGSSSSSESKTADACGFQEYPGYDDNDRPDCMNEGWIVQTAPSGEFEIQDSLKKPFATALRLSDDYCQHSKSKGDKEDTSATEMAWWLLRWIYFDREGDEKDVNARLEFLHNYLNHKNFYAFMSHDKAWDMARANPGKVVIFMDNTVPGNLNFNLVVQGQPYSSMHNIDERWLPEQPSLLSLARDQFQRPVKLMGGNGKGKSQQQNQLPDKTKQKKGKTKPKSNKSGGKKKKSSKKRG